MRFLADMGVSMTTVDALRAEGHDVTHLRDEGLQRMEDVDILEKADHEGRVVIAFDLDFGDLLAANLGDRPSVILLRMRNKTPMAVNPRLRRVIAECESDLASGAMVSVSDSTYRVRRLPLA